MAIGEKMKRREKRKERGREKREKNVQNCIFSGFSLQKLFVGGLSILPYTTPFNSPPPIGEKMIKFTLYTPVKTLRHEDKQLQSGKKKYVFIWMDPIFWIDLLRFLQNNQIISNFKQKFAFFIGFL